MIRLLSVRNAAAAAVFVVAALTGCAVGPDFVRPEAPQTDDYTETALPAETAAAAGSDGAAQRFVVGRDIPGQWWSLFRSAPLERLIARAVAESPTLVSVRAALRQAQENLRARTGTEYSPSLDANFSAGRQKISGIAFGQPDLPNSIFSLFNASVNVSYALDVFGGGRRELEALRSQVDYQRYQLEGAYLALTANIVTAAVKEGSLRARIRATQSILALQEEQLGVVKRQFELGGVARTDLLAQESQLAQARTTLPPLEKELAQNRHLLAVLSGSPPGAAGLPDFDLDGLELPRELPVSLPSALARQRPDIRAAEELLHAASAQVGVATANLYPQITLSGSFGSESGRITDLFGSGTSLWSLGAGLLQPIFHGGELTAKRRAAIAAYDQATAQYRSIVLQSLQNVADVLRALDDDARALKAQAEAEASARETFELTRQQFQFGAVTYLSLLNAERQYQQAQIALVEARAARFADTAALFQALGGGWWNRPAEGGAAPDPAFVEK